MPERVIEFGPYRLESERVYDSRNQQIELPEQAIKVLRALLEHTLIHGQTALSGEAIRRAVWHNRDVDKNNLHQQIIRLRKAFGAHAIISTSGPRGYRFALPVRLSGQAAHVRWRALSIMPFVCPPGYFKDEERLRLGGYHLALGVSHALRQITRLEIREIAPQYLQPGWQPNAAQIAREQHTELVLTGHLTAASASDELRLQLIEAKNASVLWSGKFSTTLTDTAVAEQEIASQIADALGCALPVKATKHPPHPEAVAHFRRGYYLFGTQFGVLNEAFDEYTHALALDDNYAEPWVGIAEIWAVRSAFAPAVYAPNDGMPKALVAAQRALELDPYSSRAHAAHATVAFLWEWNTPQSIHHLREAIKYGPDNAWAFLWLGRVLLVTDTDKAEGLKLAQRAWELAPHLVYVGAVLALIYYYAGRQTEAANLCNELIAQAPFFPPSHAIYAFIQMEQGYFEEAATSAQTAIQLGENLISLSMLGYIHGRSGRRAEAEQVLQELIERRKQVYVSPYHFAIVHTGLDHHQTALDYLEEALKERSEWLTHLRVDHRLNSLHGEARFEALLKQVGLFS